MVWSISNTNVDALKRLEAHLSTRSSLVTKSVWVYFNHRTSVAMLDIRGKEGASLDRKFHTRPLNKKVFAEMDLGGTIVKVRSQVEHVDLTKFLSLEPVESVFADEAAEAQQDEAKKLAKEGTTDHGDVSDMQLLRELKKSFVMNYEATGMGVKTYHDSLVKDR
jgi:hypothetical protein